jgi:hypothetical protein
MEYPEEPFQIIQHDGEVVGLRARNFTLKFTCSSNLCYTETGRVLGGKCEIKNHSYHFNPNNVPNLFPYRIDKEENSPPHGNHYDGSKQKYDPSWPEHLYYGQHIYLNIQDFNLALAIRTALLYISTEQYPFENKNAKAYNDTNDTLRGQIQ